MSNLHQCPREINDFYNLLFCILVHCKLISFVANFRARLRSVTLLLYMKITLAIAFNLTYANLKTNRNENDLKHKEYWNRKKFHIVLHFNEL